MRDKSEILLNTVKVETLHKVQTAFQDLFQIPVTLMDLRGQAVIAESGLAEVLSRNEVLELVSLNQKTLRECRRELTVKGIVAAAVPLLDGGELLGSWVFAYPHGAAYAEQLTVYLQTASAILSAAVAGHRELLAVLTDFIHLTDANVCLTDLDSGEIIMYNAAFKQTLWENEGLESPETVSLYALETGVIPPEIRTKLQNDVPEHKQSYSWSQYVAQADKWYGLTSRAIRWVDGRLAVLTTFADITEHKKEEERMHYLVYNDKRLGVPNGIKLFEDIQAAAPAGDYMICFNIQGLRKVNNLYGREAGDRLLKNIVTWVSTTLNFQYLVYRIEKDDFVVLVRDSSELAAMNLARFIYNRFEQPWDVDLDEVIQEIYVGAHMGVIEADPTVDSYERLQNLIEKVLTYARKESRLVLFDEVINDKLKEVLKFEEDLKFCVLNGMRGFSLNYQPLVNPRSGRWMGFEALCRWNRPEFGPVPPDVFILEAEKLGIISFITNWVLQEALRQVKEWRLDEVEDFMLDVNLSPLQLRDRELVGVVKDALLQNRYPAERLSLEITESAEVHFDEKTLKQLDYIRETGISLSLDDFGIGYATFSNLRSLPVDVLKTDRSFINGIETDEYLRYTVQVMIQFAHAAQIRVVAEGVETEEQKDILTEMGVNMIQGYYYSKPLTAAAMSAQLEKFRLKKPA